MGRDAREKRKKAMGEGWARKTGEKRGRKSGQDHRTRAARRKAPCGSFWHRANPHR